MIEAGALVWGISLSLLGLVAMFDMFVQPIPIKASRIIVVLAMFVGGVGGVLVIAGLGKLAYGYVI